MLRLWCRWWWELGAGGGEGDFEFFGGHVYGDVGEEWGAEVALAGVGEHAEDGGAFGGFGGDAEGSGEGGSGADADEDAFLLGQFLAPLHGVGVGDAEDLVDAVGVDGVLGELGDEVGAPALLGVRGPGGMAGGGGAVGVVGLGDAAGDHGGGVGFAEDDFGFGAFFGEDAGDAFEGAAGAEAGDPVVERVAFEVAEDLLGGGAGVDSRRWLRW